MKTSRFLSSIFSGLLSFGFLTPHALASLTGVGAGGGGNPDELRFKEVAANIQEWLQSGNADDIKLPAKFSISSYKQKMLSGFSAYDISFTNQVVKVDGVRKVCKTIVNIRQKLNIVCNTAAFERLYKQDVSSIFQLVHHEFAGAVGVENNQGSNSDYSVSRQLSSRLEEVTVKRLPVLPPAPLKSEISDEFIQAISMPGKHDGKCTNTESDVADNKLTDCKFEYSIESTSISRSDSVNDIPAIWIETRLWNRGNTGGGSLFIAVGDGLYTPNDIEVKAGRLHLRKNAVRMGTWRLQNGVALLDLILGDGSDVSSTNRIEFHLAKSDSGLEFDLRANTYRAFGTIN